jgi:putative SOS response-associated peptidase YedK
VRRSRRRELTPLCGRFNLTAPGEELAEAFDLAEAPLVTPRFNIAPSQPIVTVCQQPGAPRRDLVELSWGLSVAAGSRPGERFVVNVRAESASRSPAIRDAFARRRCLVPATGFYEWQRTASARPRPWLFRLESGRVFALAGLWQPGAAAGASASCAILTTAPNDLVKPIHDRMPALVDPADYAAWLDPTLSDARRLQPLLRPFPAAPMTAFPVNPAVNNAANDDPRCIQPE